MAVVLEECWTMTMVSRGDVVPQGTRSSQTEKSETDREGKEVKGKKIFSIDDVSIFVNWLSFVANSQKNVEQSKRGTICPVCKEGFLKRYINLVILFALTVAILKPKHGAVLV